jgi:uncharacterized protein YbcV (DUF1398 family)
MSSLTEKLIAAQKHAMSIRPSVGGFPVLAEVLRQAGVHRNLWQLPSCQAIYVMADGCVIQQGEPLFTGTHEVPSFDQEALIKALRTDQAGQSTFAEFLQATWVAGVVSYDVDFQHRKVSYYGAKGETYVEEYPTVFVK